MALACGRQQCVAVRKVQLSETCGDGSLMLTSVAVSASLKVLLECQRTADNLNVVDRDCRRIPFIVIITFCKTKWVLTNCAFCVKSFI